MKREKHKPFDVVYYNLEPYLITEIPDLPGNRALKKNRPVYLESLKTPVDPKVDKERIPVKLCDISRQPINNISKPIDQTEAKEKDIDHGESDIGADF